MSTAQPTPADRHIDTVITRKQYLAKASGEDAFGAHREYYAQFVTEKTVEQVLFAVGLTTLRREVKRDKHFNSINIRRWDNLCYTGGHTNRQGPFTSHIDYDHDRLAAAGDFMTRAGLVAVAKEAARIAVERTEITTLDEK